MRKVFLNYPNKILTIRRRDETRIIFFKLYYIAANVWNSISHAADLLVRETLILAFAFLDKDRVSNGSAFSVDLNW
jgi:hypothetical protein